jgi:tetratricopeptide (TPR) repeat protein
VSVGPVKLSLCMIVRDEIDFLDACLDAAEPCVDEIVIADTGSRDGTWGRVQARADRALRIPWHDHFGEARNASLEAAGGDWVLILDADEVLRAEGTALRAAIAIEDALAWRLEVRSDVGEGRSERFHALRLFRRRPEIRFTGRIHEQVTPAIDALTERENGWHVDELSSVHIDHAGYRPEVAQARGKRERNVRLLERALADDPDEPYLHYKLFQALGREGAPARRHLDLAALRLLATPRDELRRHGVAAEALTAAAQSWLAEGRAGAALAACGRVLDELGSHPATRLVGAQALLAQGRLAEARLEIARALDEPPPQSGFHYDRASFEAAGLRLLEIVRSRAKPDRSQAR